MLLCARVFVCHYFLNNAIVTVITPTYAFSFFFGMLCYLLILLLILNIYLTTIQRSVDFFTVCLCNYFIKRFLFYFIIYYLVILLILLRFLHIKTCTLFFGQIILTPQNLRLLYIFILWYALIIYLFMHWHFSISNLLIYSFVTYLLNCSCWLLWTCASLFTIIFLFDMLNLLLYLLFFNALDKKYLKVNDQVWLGGFLSGFTIFFWMSFLSTICFLLYSYYMYITVHTFNIYLLNINVLFLYNNVSCLEFIKLYFYFFFLAIFIALKLGIAPFFLWKFSFFQNLNFFALFIYLFSYYFLISIFFFINFYNYFLYSYLYIRIYIYVYLCLSTAVILIKFNKVNTIYTFYIYSSLLNLNIILVVLFVIIKYYLILL